MTFLNDLALGEQYQSFILQLLNQHFRTKNNRYKSNDNKKDVDIVATIGKPNIEVKFDRQSASTWNIFIEYACNWKISWVFKYEHMDVFIYWTTEEIYFFHKSHLQSFIIKSIHNKVDWTRKVSWWDRWASKWILIKKEVAERLAFRKLTIKYNYGN